MQLRWIYYRTKSKPDVKIIEAILTKEEATKNFKAILETVDEIKKLVGAKTKSKDLERTESACFKYGRCPYYVECKYGARATTESNETQQVKSEISLKNEYSPTRESFHLYIDCAPTKTDTVYKQTIELSDLLKPVLTKIQNEKELSHYRLAGYGQHVGLIANYLSEYLKNNIYDSHTAILSSLRTPEGCDTQQTLTAAAGKVVRGF